MSGILCKPKFMECVVCKHNTNPKESFCMEDIACSVPYAIVKDGKILAWADNNSVDTHPN